MRRFGKGLPNLAAEKFLTEEKLLKLHNCNFYAQFWFKKLGKI